MYLTSSQEETDQDVSSSPTTLSNKNGYDPSLSPSSGNLNIDSQENVTSPPSLSSLDPSTASFQTMSGSSRPSLRPSSPSVPPSDTSSEHSTAQDPNDVLDTSARTINNLNGSLPSSPSYSLEYSNAFTSENYDNTSFSHSVQSPNDFANNSEDLIAHEPAPFITSRRYSSTPPATSSSALDSSQNDRARQENMLDKNSVQPRFYSSLESSSPPPYPIAHSKTVSSPSTTAESRRSNLTSPTSPISPHRNSSTRTALSSAKAKRLSREQPLSSRSSSVIENDVSKHSSYGNMHSNFEFPDDDYSYPQSAREELRDRYLTSLAEYRNPERRSHDTSQTTMEDGPQIQSQRTSTRRRHHHSPDYWDNRSEYISLEENLRPREPEMLQSSGSTVGKRGSLSRRRYGDQLYTEIEDESAPTIRSITPSSSHDYSQSSSSYVSRRHGARYRRNDPLMSHYHSGLTAPRRKGPETSPLLSASSSGSLRMRANARSPALMSSRPSSSQRDVKETHYDIKDPNSPYDGNSLSNRLTRRRSRDGYEYDNVLRRQMVPERLLRKASVDYSRDDQVDDGVEDLRKRISALDPSRPASRATVEESYGNSSARNLRKFTRANHGHRLSLQQFNFSTPENRDRAYHDTGVQQRKEASVPANSDYLGHMKTDRPWTSMERHTGLNHRFSRAQSVPVDSEGPVRSHSRQTDIWSISEENVQSEPTFKAQHILLETLEQFQSYFMRQIEQQSAIDAQRGAEAEVEVDHFINRISNLVGITTRLNSGVRNFVNMTMNSEETNENWDQVEKSLKPLVKASEDQCRTLTESLLAFIRVDRGYSRHMNGDAMLSSSPGAIEDKDRFIRAQTTSPPSLSSNKRASMDARYSNPLAKLERHGSGSGLGTFSGLGLSPTINSGDDGSKFGRLRPSPLSERAGRYSDRSLNRRSADYFGRLYTNDYSPSFHSISRLGKFPATSKDPAISRAPASDNLKGIRSGTAIEEGGLYQERREPIEENESPGKIHKKEHRRKSTLSLRNSGEGLGGGVYIPRSGTARPQQTSERVEKDQGSNSTTSTAEQLRADLRKHSSL